MRDLEKDLEICNKATPGPWECRGEYCDGINTAYHPENKTRTKGYGCDNTFIADLNDDEYHIYSSLQEQIANAEFIAQAREGWPHAIERAIKAEAEVERLKPIEEFADKNFKLWENAAYSMNAKLRAENALLRKVVDAARIAVDNAGRVRVGQNPVYDLRQALAELDRKEGGEMTTWEAWVIETQNKIRALESDLYDYRERAIKAEAKLDRLIEGCMRCAGEDDHERFQRLRAEVERLRMALDKIANPLKYIQIKTKTKNAELNGVYAIMLSKDPSYLQEIALAELDKVVKKEDVD
jgi:hypothetical protein